MDAVETLVEKAHLPASQRYANLSHSLTARRTSLSSRLLTLKTVGLKLIQAHLYVLIKALELELELLGLLPCEVLVGEVTVLGGLEVDGVDEVELLDDDTGAEVEVVLDNLDELVGGALRGAVCLDEEREGLGDTDGVGQLHECATCELGLNQGLGDPARKVRGGTVDLGVVLSGESTTSVGTPATVGVDDDLTSGETGVTLGTTDDEETGGLDLAMLVCWTDVRKFVDIRGRRSCHRASSRG